LQWLNLPGQPLLFDIFFQRLSNPSHFYIYTTMFLWAFLQKNARFGMGAICIGGGEATAMIIEKI